MQNSIQKVAFSRFNGVLLNSNKKGEPISEFLLASIQEVLMSYNFTLSKELFSKILETEANVTIDLFKNDVFPMLAELFADKGYKPLYPDFPLGVTEDSTDIYFYQILHYLFLVTPEDLGVEESNKIESLKSKVVQSKELNLVTDKEILALAKQLMESNVVLSESDKLDLFTILDYFNNTVVKQLMEDTNIVIKETMIDVSIYLGSRGLASPSLKTATDVLRLIAQMSGVPLDKKYVHFKKFNRSEINMFITNLEAIGFLKDDMNTYKKVWKKFFKIFGNRVKFEKYPNVKDAVDYLFGKSEHTTMGYKLEKALLDFKQSSDLSLSEQMKSLDSLLDLYKKRSGVFARNLITLLSETNELKINHSEKYIVKQFLSVVDGVNSRILYQLLDRINNISVGRFVKVSGEVVRLQETKNISEDIIEYLKQELISELSRRASLKEPMGLVYIDDSLKDIAFTTSQKDANGSLHPMTRGSKLSILDNSEVIRIFVYWENTENSVDIDASFTFLDNEFLRREEVAYYTRKSLRKGAIKHSGDIVDAPDGAIEYIDINLKKLSEGNNDDLKYALMQIHSYSQDTFNNMTVRAGVMQLTSEEAEHEKLFKSSAVTHIFDLTTETTNNKPLLFDLENREIIWLDTSFSQVKYINNAYFDFTINPVADYLKYIVEKTNISVYDVLKLNAEARGILLENLPDNEEDLQHVKVFDKISDVNPLQLAELVSDFM